MVVHSEKLPRSFWKLGKVEKVIPGCDGLIRGALVRVASRGRQATHLYRPIQLLFPLEMDRCHTADNPTTAEKETATPTVNLKHILLPL